MHALSYSFAKHRRIHRTNKYSVYCGFRKFGYLAIYWSWIWKVFYVIYFKNAF